MAAGRVGMRAQLSKEDIGKAFDRVIAETLKRLKEQGDAGFASRHEALGVITEEYHELVNAARNNDTDGEFIKECLDVAVGCVIAVATLSNRHPSAREG